MKSPTPEECTKIRYGSGYIRLEYDPRLCAEGVWSGVVTHYQCTRKPGHGAYGLYCKQHAKRYPAECACVAGDCIKETCPMEGKK